MEYHPAVEKLKELVSSGELGEIYYLSSDGLIGYDHEGTIDGTHLNDLGMKRISEKIEGKIKEIYKERETTFASNGNPGIKH